MNTHTIWPWRPISLYPALWIFMRRRIHVNPISHLCPKLSLFGVIQISVKCILISVGIVSDPYSPTKGPLQRPLPVSWIRVAALATLQWHIHEYLSPYMPCITPIQISEITITHCLGLGHETMICAVCRSAFLSFVANSNYEILC